MWRALVPKKKNQNFMLSLAGLFLHTFVCNSQIHLGSTVSHVLNWVHDFAHGAKTTMSILRKLHPHIPPRITVIQSLIFRVTILLIINNSRVVVSLIQLQAAILSKCDKNYIETVDLIILSSIYFICKTIKGSINILSVLNVLRFSRKILILQFIINLSIGVSSVTPPVQWC